jgi:hypothetical protein
MGAFDPGNSTWFFRCGIWRLKVSRPALPNGGGSLTLKVTVTHAKLSAPFRPPEWNAGQARWLITRIPSS